MASGCCSELSTLNSELSLALEEVELVYIDRLHIPEEGNDDCQTHRHFRSCHGHDKKDKDLPVQRVEEPGKSHEAQIDRVEHQLDGHEDDDGVAP